MNYSVTLEDTTHTFDGQPVRQRHSVNFPSMQEACDFVDDSRRDGEAGDIIRRFTDGTLIEKWTIR